ncbi:hypothetical protein GCM10027020_21540 [Nocardioides salsibiostraticola]
MQDFDEFRSGRPLPQPPSDEVITRAKEKMMNAIELETRTTQTPRNEPAITRDQRHRFRARWVKVAATVAAAAAVTAVAVTSGQPDQPDQNPAVIQADGPAVVFRLAAEHIESSGPATGSGTIRYQQFRNLTDPGTPTYDVYIRPNGTAMVGEPGAQLEASDGYLTAAQLASLPAEPTALKARMLVLSRGLGSPGERPERALYRLATDLLPDAGVSNEVKASIYRILADFDLEAIRAQDLGLGADPTGRTGEVVEFTFEEGTTDRLVLDRRTGALLSTESILPDGSFAGGQVYLNTDMVSGIPGTGA